MNILEPLEYRQMKDYNNFLITQIQTREQNILLKDPDVFIKLVELQFAVQKAIDNYEWRG